MISKLPKVTEGSQVPSILALTWPRKKPEAGLEVLEQSSYLSAEGCTHTEPVGIVTAAAQDFTDLALAEEQLNHHPSRL